MRDKYKHNGRLYEYNPCGYCGVYMPKHVMQKIAKKAVKFQNDVREILTEHQHELLEAHWALAYPDGKQTTVKYGNRGDIERRIALFKPDAPKPLDCVYIAEPLSNELEEIIQANGGHKEHNAHQCEIQYVPKEIKDNG